MRLISKLDRFLEDKNYKIIIKENEINIINIEEVIDFSPSKIIIKCKKNTINVEGKNLVIKKMVEEEVLITGIIFNVRIN